MGQNASGNTSRGYENSRGKKKMTARTLMFFMIPLLVLLLCFPLACSQSSLVNDDQYPEEEGQIMPDKVIKTDKEW